MNLGAKPKLSRNTSIEDQPYVRKKIKQERLSDSDSSHSDDERGGDKPHKSPDRTVLDSVSMLQCDICRYLKVQTESNSPIFLVSDEERQILSFHYNFKIDAICRYHHRAIFTTFEWNSKRKCCDPLQKHGKAIKINLKCVDLELAQNLRQYTNLDVKPRSCVCRDCFQLLQNLVNEEFENQQNLIDSQEEVGASASQFSNYSDGSSLQGLREGNVEVEVEPNQQEKDYSELLKNLKEKFPGFSKDQKKAIFEILPSNWSVRKISDMTGATHHEAFQKTKVNEPRKEHCNKLSVQDVSTITQFYLRTDVSWTSPNVNDRITIRQDGEKLKVSRRLLNYKISEAYFLFKQEFPNVKVGLSKFAELRPQQVKLVGSKNSHDSCYCVGCRNPELLILTTIVGEDNGFTALFGENYSGQVTPLEFSKLIVCPKKHEDCYISNTCDSCKDRAETLKENMLAIFESLSVEEVNFEQWSYKDWSRMHPSTLPVESFCDKFIQDIVAFKKHNYISLKQAVFKKDLTQNLPTNHMIIQMDFAQNFQFSTQHAVQSNYFKHSECSLFTTVVFFNDDGKKQKKPVEHIVIVSDNKEHTTGQVAVYVKKIHSYLSSKYPNIEYVHYQTDGAGSHFKNKYTLTTVANHKDLYGTECSYHFSCSGHGKAEVDGLGSVVKGGCRDASMRKHARNPINTVEDMVQFINGNDITGKPNFPSVVGFLVKDAEIQATKLEFSDRFSASIPVRGIRQMHCFASIPGRNDVLKSKMFSSSPTSKIVTVMDVKDTESE